MKKLIIASAVSAIFVAPATALAQARAGSAPTLDKVFEASGLSVSGYLDAAYTRANRDLESGAGVSTRAFDSQNDSFALHQLGLTLAKQPREGFGGLVNVTMGKDAQVIHSFPEFTTTTSGSMFDLTQAYAQYATGPFTVIGGKFTTLHGTEVIASPGNVNISRSMLFGAVPFTHTGVRGTWALSDTVSLIAGVNNGWDQVTDANRGKTLELGASLNPIKPLTIAVSGYSGKEPTNNGANDGTRASINAVASYTITDTLSVGAEVLAVSQDNFDGAGGKAKYNGVAGYVAYMFAPRWRGAARVELFDDKDGFHFNTTGGNKYTEATVTVSYFAADNMELRAEGRLDRANNNVFANFNDATPSSKTLATVGVQGIYKF
jgi:Putative beta-barrel porin-2, OmpL-like. bbp2